MMHPAKLMMAYWGALFFAYFVLPFQLYDRFITLEGLVFLVIFLFSFCFGSWFKFRKKNSFIAYKKQKVSFKHANLILKAACLISISALLMDLPSNLFDLSALTGSRNSKAGDLLLGNASSSSLAFKIAFLTYPAAFIYLALHIIYEDRLNIFQISFYSILPIALTSLSMGGRAPILYIIAILFFSIKIRNRANKNMRLLNKKLSTKKLKLLISLVFIVAISLYYFSEVFFIRAEAINTDLSALQDFYRVSWDVDFLGPGSDIFLSFFGEKIFYLIFIFGWYLVQGLIMSIYILGNYEGEYLLGVYGIDLFTAIARRFNGDFVNNGFQSLLEFNIYGFFPSSFGSLYIDFSFFGIIFCFFWGVLSGVTYRKIKTNYNSTWSLLYPFIYSSIVFSSINTPLGFTNGFVTYIWLAITFFFLKSKVRPNFRTAT
jgi:hypothetical protein